MVLLQLLLPKDSKLIDRNFSCHSCCCCANARIPCSLCVLEIIAQRDTTNSLAPRAKQNKFIVMKFREVSMRIFQHKTLESALLRERRECPCESATTKPHTLWQAERPGAHACTRCREQITTRIQSSPANTSPNSACSRVPTWLRLFPSTSHTGTPAEA